MNNPVRKSAYMFFAAFLQLFPGVAGAAQQQGIGFYFDQDLMLPFFNEDRDYTMGLTVEFFRQEEGLYLLDRMAHWFGRRMGALQGEHASNQSFGIGTVNFTPDDLSAVQPVTTDRPYSSLIFLFNKSVQASDDRAVGVEARVGVLGTSVAREVQRGLHSWWRDFTASSEPVDPKGWDNQISNGGEPTLRFRLSHARRLGYTRDRWDIARTWDLSVGYQTNASIGLSGRVGRLASPFWSIPFDPINRGNFVPSVTRDEIYAWAASRLRLVAYDVLLQGQFRDSELTYDAGDIERLVMEAGVGITVSWHRLQLTVAANAKSAALRRGAGNRTHLWGGTYIAWAF